MGRTDGGAVLFRPNEPKRPFVTYPVKGPPQALFTNAVWEEDGGVLLGTGAGLYRLRRIGAEAVIERIDLPTPPEVHESDFVNTINKDRNGDLWVGAASGLYRRGPEGGWTRYTTQDGLPNNFVGRLVADPDGRIWVCTQHGLARISANPRQGTSITDLTLTERDGLPSMQIRAIWFASDGRRWIATGEGLVEWLETGSAGPRFRVYTDENGLSDRYLSAFAEDPAGNLWIGSRRGGAMRLASGGFSVFGAAGGLAFSGNDRIVETQSGEICVASIFDPRCPVRCYDGRAFRTHYPNFPRDVLARPFLVHDAIQDHLGAWWFSGRSVLRFRGLRLREAPDLRLSPDIESGQLYEDSRGDLWITTASQRGFGLRRWERATGRLHDHARDLPPQAREQELLG